MSTRTTRRGSVTGTSGGALPGALSGAQEQRERRAAQEQAAANQPAFGTSLSDLRKQQAQQRAAVEEQAEHDPDDPYAGMTRKERRQAEKEARQLGGTFDDHPHLLALKPREKYVFRSDYFHIDDSVASILGFFHNEASHDAFTTFWGINRIPGGLEDGVSTIVLEQVRRMGEKWVQERIKTSEKLDKLDENEQNQTGTTSSRRKAAKIADDTEIASAEIQDGASYLHVHNRLMIKAPNLETLDASIEKITRLYIERFGTLRAAAYPGEQRPELTNLFGKNEKKRGKGFHFTSTEFAGSHSLVTNGLNDPTGEYVGYMEGDVNSSAVLFDVNAYEHHIVVADDTISRYLNRARIPDMWGSKISQSCLLDNGRSVHIVLDGADMNTLGPRLDGLTARLDMNSGDINMFEMFGNEKDELSIYPAHQEKIVLMAEQAYPTTEDDRSIIRGSLKKQLTSFYVNKNMWSFNAKHNRDRLRLVNLPHTQVPRLQDIVTYFDTAYKGLVNSTARDDNQMKAYNVLRLLFTDLLDNHGDLFNTHTNDEIDGVETARRVIYDFSRLLKRGRGVAMAQLVNVIGFAVESLGVGDSVIIHGTEHIDDRVKGYINDQFEHLFARGGRVAYLYNSVEKMLGDSKFNRFDTADYTLLGPMSDSVIGDYQKQLAQSIPPDLERLMTTKASSFNYLRREHTNVVFRVDLALGVNPAREGRRAEIVRPTKEERVHSSAVFQAAAAGDRAQEREERMAQEGRRAKLMKPNSRGPKKTAETSAGAAAPVRSRLTRNR